jgi:Domain of unknown function (DUF4864)
MADGLCSRDLSGAVKRTRREFVYSMARSRYAQCATKTRMNWKTRSSIMRALVLLVAFSIGSTVIAGAGEDLATGQSVIRSQEEAFSRDDAAAAYTFAAPSIRSWYRTPETFMYMVRNGYAPVYRHRSFEFGEATILDGKIMQQVHIIDADGVAWEALYTLEPQSDGTLKISACVLTKAVIS